MVMWRPVTSDGVVVGAVAVLVDKCFACGLTMVMWRPFASDDAVIGVVAVGVGNGLLWVGHGAVATFCLC
jgi:hypothetical protein